MYFIHHTTHIIIWIEFLFIIIHHIITLAILHYISIDSCSSSSSQLWLLLIPSSNNKNTPSHTWRHRTNAQQIGEIGNVSYHHTKAKRLQVRKQFILGFGDVLQVYQTKVFMDPRKYSRHYKDSTYSACSFFHRGRKEYIVVLYLQNLFSCIHVWACNKMYNQFLPDLCHLPWL